MIPALHITFVTTHADILYSVRTTANATTMRSATVYVYKSRNLFIAYGISIFVSTLSVIVGAYAMYLNGFVYDTSPSTFGLALRRDEVRADAVHHANTETLITSQVKEVMQQKKERSKKMKIKYDPDRGFMLKSQDSHPDHEQ